MSNWRTTLAGLAAGVCVAAGSGLALPDPWPEVLRLLAGAALAALGYHAADCDKCPGRGLRAAAGLVVLVCVTLAAGCAVSTLNFGVASPTFGTVKFSLGGGSIGHGATNAPQPVETPPAPTSAH